MPFTDEKPFSRKQRVSRTTLNEAAGSRVKEIVAGPGILIRRNGGTYIIEATEQAGARGSGGNRWTSYHGT